MKFVFVSSVIVLAFFLGVWAESHFGSRYTMNAEGMRLDQRTGEVVYAGGGWP